MEEKNMRELSLDEMSTISGGAATEGENAELDGTVIEALDNAYFNVDIGGQIVKARMSVKLRMNYIRILPGNKVRVKGTVITYKYMS